MHEDAKNLWEKYLMITQEMKKFIDKQDIDTFLELVPQRDQLIALLEEIPDKSYLKLEEFKAIGAQIIPLDREIMYKARAWLNKSRRQNSMVRAYDLTSATFGTQGNSFNRSY